MRDLTKRGARAASRDPVHEGASMVSDGPSFAVKRVVADAEQRRVRVPLIGRVDYVGDLPTGANPARFVQRAGAWTIVVKDRKKKQAQVPDKAQLDAAA